VTRRNITTCPARIGGRSGIMMLIRAGRQLVLYVNYEPSTTRQFGDGLIIEFYRSITSYAGVPYLGRVPEIFHNSSSSGYGTLPRSASRLNGSNHVLA